MRFLIPLGMLCIGLTACETIEPEAPRPNIVMIMADDLGWGDVGFNGGERVLTPHLDALAASGIRLTRFYSASPVCSPTRASVLTGRNPYRMGITTANEGHLPEEEVTLAEILSDEGYVTGLFGKWHLGTLSTLVRDSNRGRPGDSTHFTSPLEHGFDEFFATEAKVPTFDPMVKPAVFDTASGEGLRYGWAARSPETTVVYGSRYWSGPNQVVNENLEGDNSRIIMDRVIPFIRKASEKKQPFLTVIWPHTPHLPVVADQAYRDRYPDLSLEEQIYYGTISAMDDQIGRLVSELEAAGVRDDTMIWFASDNGPEDRTPGSPGPFRERKRSLYEGGVRVPAFTVWPDHFERGVERELPMVTSDYLPTMVDLLGLSIQTDHPLDGVSLANQLLGLDDVRGSPIGFRFGRRMSWVTDELKVISTDNGATFEMYNLGSDPYEAINLAPENLAVSEQLVSDLRKWFTEIDSD